MAVKKDAKKPAVKTPEKKAVAKKPAKKEPMQKRLIEEAATAANGGKPVRGGPKRAKPKLDGYMHDYQKEASLQRHLCYAVPADLESIAELDMSKTDINHRTIDTVATDICAATNNSVFKQALAVSLIRMHGELNILKRSHAVTLGTLKLDMRRREQLDRFDDSDMELCLSMTVTLDRSRLPTFPDVQYKQAQKVLEHLFNTKLTVNVDFSNPIQYMFKVDGNYTFNMDDVTLELPEPAPVAKTPEDAIIELFYMVYAHLVAKPGNHVYSADGCDVFGIVEMDEAMMREEWQ